jgi:Rrf2 family protein
VNNLVNMTEGAYLAMHSLALIAQKQPERLTVKHLAEELDASQAHLAKVFQKLSKAELVTSVRGPAGGFILNKDPKEINFLNIYEIMEGKITRGACPLGKEKCAFHSCIFSNEFHRISDDLYNTYKKITLADFTA